jgi:maltose O-acetyltransferase
MYARESIQRVRIACYRQLWTCSRIEGSPSLRSPALLAGAGTICFGADVTLGWRDGPGFYAGYSYIEARHPESVVAIGADSHLNNCVTIVSEGAGVVIGRRCLMGPGVHIYDSDFHALDAGARATSPPRRARVEIADDVFIGSNAIVLKGVSVGTGSIIGAGAVVVADVSEGTVVAGNPARVVRE